MVALPVPVNLAIPCSIWTTKSPGSISSKKASRCLELFLGARLCLVRPNISVSDNTSSRSPDLFNTKPCPIFSIPGFRTEIPLSGISSPSSYICVLLSLKKSSIRVELLLEITILPLVCIKPEDSLTKSSKSPLKVGAELKGIKVISVSCRSVIPHGVHTILLSQFSILVVISFHEIWFDGKLYGSSPRDSLFSFNWSIRSSASHAAFMISFGLNSIIITSFGK